MNAWLPPIAVLAVAGILIFAIPWLGRKWHITLRRSKSADGLKCDAKGFTIHDPKSRDYHALKVMWTNVVNVVAFKRDLLTVDSISLGMRLVNGAELEFPEDIEGWPEFAQSLENHLRGSKPFHEHFMAVAFPAFESNMTEILTRGTAPAANADT